MADSAEAGLESLRKKLQSLNVLKFVELKQECDKLKLVTTKNSNKDELVEKIKLALESEIVKLRPAEDGEGGVARVHSGKQARNDDQAHIILELHEKLQEKDRLISEMEKRNANLETIIALLELRGTSNKERRGADVTKDIRHDVRQSEGHTSVKNRVNQIEIESPKPKTYSETLGQRPNSEKPADAYTVNDHEPQHKHDSTNAKHTTHSQQRAEKRTEKVNTANKEFTIVSRKNQRPRKYTKTSAVIGISKCSDVTEDPGLQRGPKKMWLHVSKLDKKTTVSDMKRFLCGKLHEEEFIIEKLESAGVYSAFKVGANFSLMDTLYDPSFWAEGIAVRRFFLVRTKAEHPT
jgi:hypothetical protein